MEKEQQTINSEERNGSNQLQESRQEILSLLEKTKQDIQDIIANHRQGHSAPVAEKEEK